MQLRDRGERSLLSTKPIPRRERLIVALDVASHDEAQRLVDALGDSIQFYKVGLELFWACNYRSLPDWLTARRKQVFADLKLFDVPQTVRSAVRQLTHCGARFVTVHGNDRMLEAACEVKGELKVLAVTVLTSLYEGDLRDLGFPCDVEALVLSRARRALTLGCDGVISSGLEARALRQELGPKLLVVTPGIRPVANHGDDQKRTVSAEEVFRNGADYIVVGRPIKDASDPRGAALEIQRSIEKLFES